MINKKEPAFIVGTIILMALILEYQNIINVMGAGTFALSLLFSAVIILVSFFAKKITAYLLDDHVYVRTLLWFRWGIGKRSHFKYPIPIGMLLPIILSYLSSGIIQCFTFLQFTATSLPSKVSKRYGRKRFSGIMDWDDALIVFWSAVPLLVLGIIFRAMGGTALTELSKLSVIYLLWNLIPIGQLDGVKLFFGSRPLFVFTWILTLTTTWIVLF